MRKEKKVKNNKKVGKDVKNNKEAIVEGIRFKFTNFYFKSVKTKSGFTNYQKDIYETHSVFLKFLKLIKHFDKMKVSELKNQRHCHFIDNKKGDEDRCYEVLNQYNKSEKEKIDFYQFGIEGFRVITQKLNENTYELLFLDTHHLIHPDDDYNQRDYQKLSCCIRDLCEKDRESNQRKCCEENKELRKKIKDYEKLLETKTLPV